jgi:hypothetical protein
LEKVFSEISPEKLLWPISKYFNDERFPIVEGMEPLNMLYSRLRC